MRNFDYTKLSERLWDGEVVSYIAKINECKGRQELFTRQKLVELERLLEVARIQSTEASNKIEGIVTTSARIRQLMDEKTMPKSRSEQEIVGYRDVLATIHESHDFIPLAPNYILQLHRDLLKHTGLSYGGKFKTAQNYISETKADGSVVTRFVPLAPYETEAAVAQICQSCRRVAETEFVEPLILIPAFIIDFLCIHPFNDGNGRMARLLTLLLLYQSGYEVGKYVSVERQIEKTKDLYYDALQSCGFGWHEGQNDIVPFVKYMLKIILACYRDFEERVGIMESGGTRASSYDIVRKYALEKVGKFTSGDVIEECPSVARSSALAALARLLEEGVVEKLGAGRSTQYVRKN